MTGPAEGLTLVVTAVKEVVPGIRSLTLAARDGGELPSYTPGGHLVVNVPAGEDRTRRQANAYSLTGETVHPSSYSISVRRSDPEQGGAGGSAWVHELRVGDVVTATPPRSAFAPVQLATRHLLVGAGIGITPLVSHLRASVRWGREAELVYLFRDGHGAHVDELKELGGDRVTFVNDRRIFAEHLAERLADQPIGAHLYVCGPSGFMDLVVETARSLGWPASRIHLEAFGLEVLDPGDPFTVGIDGTTVEVPSGVSLLEALEEHGYNVANMCRQGVCGECRVRVTPAAGSGVLHRDLYLSDAEKAAGDSAMACVSRAQPADGGPDAPLRAHLEVSL